MMRSRPTSKTSASLAFGCECESASRAASSFSSSRRGTVTCEQRVVPEVPPRALPVEVREGVEELGERFALTAEQRDEDVGELACGAHDRSFSRVLAAS
jgi:hypothetical protein